MAQSERLNILVAAHMPCIPQTNGYSIRVYSLYSRLAMRHNLTWILPWDYGVLDDPLYKNLLIGQPSHNLRHKLQTRFLRLLKKLPQNTRWVHILSSFVLHPAFFARPGMYYIPEIAWFKTALQKHVNSGKFDLLMVEHELLGEFIPHHINIPVMLIMQNLPTMMFERADKVMNGPQRNKYLSAVQRRRIQKHQNNMLRQADMAVFMSPDDERFAKEASPNIRSIVVPNGVDVEYFQPRPDISVNLHELVFIGTINYFPNEDAIQYLCEAIMPYVKQAGLDVMVTIIGTGEAPASLKERAEYSNMRWVGAVDDVRPYIASAGAFIVPLRVGSGTRLKVLTAMAMGIPVISTRVGAEGIHALDGETILLADTPQEFAEAIRKVLLMPDLRARLIQNGRALMEREYSWDRIAPTLETACLELVRRSQPVNHS